MATSDGANYGGASTLYEAMVMCEKEKRGCNSIMKRGSGFTIFKARKITSPHPGTISYVLSGTALKSDGYLWAMKKDWTLTGYDDDTAYKTLKDATKACAASDSCKGVTKEEHSYRTNNHNMASQRKGRVAYILGDQYELHQSKFVCLSVCLFLFRILYQPHHYILLLK